MKKFKLLLITCLAMVMLFANSISVFASDVDNTEITVTDEEVKDFAAKSNYDAILKIVGDNHIKLITTQGLDADWSKIEVGSSSYLIDTIGFNNLRTEVARIKEIKNQAQQDQKDVAEQIVDIGNVNPDLSGAQKTFDGFMPAINYILGLIVTLVTVGMSVLCACDILFITFPMFRGKCETMKQEGKGTSQGRTDRAGEARLFFISDEAEYAINTADTAQTGKNPLVIYFGKRAISYIVLAVVIFILLTGNLSIITNIALKAVSGILSIIQDMAA